MALKVDRMQTMNAPKTKISLYNDGEVDVTNPSHYTNQQTDSSLKQRDNTDGSGILKQNVNYNRNN